jgi:hypothetical protein
VTVTVTKISCDGYVVVIRGFYAGATIEKNMNLKIDRLPRLNDRPIPSSAFAAALNAAFLGSGRVYGRAAIMRILREKFDPNGDDRISRTTIENMFDCANCPPSFKKALDRWEWKEGTVGVGEAAAGLMALAKGGYATGEPLTKDEAKSVGIPTD